MAAIVLSPIKVLDQQIQQMEEQLNDFDGQEFLKNLNEGFSITLNGKKFTYKGFNIREGTHLKRIEEIAEKKRKEVEEVLIKMVSKSPGIDKNPSSFEKAGERFVKYQRVMLWIVPRLMMIQAMVQLEDKRKQREKLLQDQADKV
jgi:hypothetical protein